MKLEPAHDRLLVQTLSKEEVTAGGIIIPDAVEVELTAEAIILEVGPGMRNEAGKIIEMDVKKGDRIMFGLYAGTVVKIDGKELTIIRESDVMGIIKE